MRGLQGVRSYRPISIDPFEIDFVDRFGRFVQGWRTSDYLNFGVRHQFLWRSVRNWHSVQFFREYLCILMQTLSVTLFKPVG